MGDGYAVESQQKSVGGGPVPVAVLSAVKKMKYVDYPFIEPICYSPSFSSISHFMYRGTLPDVLHSFCSKFCQRFYFIREIKVCGVQKRAQLSDFHSNVS
jgi:hypothetical protein